MRHRLLAGALVLAFYLAVSFVNDARGTLGTDTGGKVATLRAMEQRDEWLDPDVGYWAEPWDHDGDLHPLYYTNHVGERWVNVTTLPLLYAAAPLYRLGGYRLVLVLPMLGAIAAAAAAAALARRLGARTATAAWLVALASPMTIYAVDFWEHSVGAAFMLWAVVCALDARLTDRRRSRALLSGLLVGTAATLRTEALVYGAVATGVVCVFLLWRSRRLGPPLIVGVLTVIGLVIPIAGNTALERATLKEPFRTERASGTAEAGGDAASERLQEGLVTGVGLQPSLSWGSAAVGGASLVLLLYAARRAGRTDDDGPAVVAGLGGAALYGVRFAEGLGFVPGMTAASPVAAASVRAPARDELPRLLLLVALLSLPLVWAFQFRGGAPAQWGGRYVLVSGVLLTVLGAVSLEEAPPFLRRGFLGLSVAVTAFGLLWVNDRTHDVARAEAALHDRPEAVLISRVAHLAREGGAFYAYGGRPWLTAVSDEQERDAVDVVRRSGAHTFAIVAGAGQAPPTFDGFRRTGSDAMEFLGVDLRVISYRRGP